MLTKNQKMKFVEQGKSDMAKYRLIGVLPLSRIPDRLVQASRNGLRPEVKFIIGRKTLLIMMLEGNEKTKKLVQHLDGTSAIVLSNDDPFDLFKKFKTNFVKMAAKPNQISPDDISVSAGETTIQPGQAVTELKQAGVDVQIQKGKVVIAKDKVIVKKGAVITPQVAKALKTLDIVPFVATITPSILLSDSMMFTREILDINPQQTATDVARGFRSALTIALEGKIVNSYTIKTFIEKSYRGAMALGIVAKIPEPGIIEKLLASATMQASALNNVVKGPEKEESKAQ